MVVKLHDGSCYFVPCYSNRCCIPWYDSCSLYAIMRNLYALSLSMSLPYDADAMANVVT